MEAQWLVLPQLQYILFFEGDHQQPPFDTVVQSLRSSLAATLATFAPLAGKLVHLAETGDVAIRCSASDEGVRFVVAESDADVRRLADEEEHDVQTFERLVPELDMTLLPAPVLAVQATRFEGGGVALGVTVHHAVADGQSLRRWRFVEAWAATCCGDTPPEPPPCFDRSRVRLPGGEELARSVLRKYTPDLPVARTSPVLQEDRLRFTRWTYTLDAQHIERLKQRIVRLGEAHGAPLASFVAVVALAWTCFVRCWSIPADEDAFLFFFADVRDRLDPPAGAGYFGACLSGCLVAALPARDLHGERALAAAASAAQGTIGEMVADPAGGWEFLRIPDAVPMERLMNVSGSSGFRAYEAGDFGWGMPRRVALVRMNQDGQVELVRARDGAGVQVSVSVLQREHVDAFKSQFLDLLE
ncbi:hypothetical protein SEVIR_7G268200v4 [Setaria viridis]|uniref:Uncharacterized protein n=1 Tax=Setaria viridis TaxID=4556 RepID=A0A4U6U0R8_SETVI|nr:hypothetical protein SEVIR_7G268200v2 [Setaria viridis]